MHIAFYLDNDFVQHREFVIPSEFRNSKAPIIFHLIPDWLKKINEIAKSYGHRVKIHAIKNKYLEYYVAA